MYEGIPSRIGGVFIVAYACEMGELGDRYLGYFKVFPVRPASFWDPHHLLYGSVSGLSATAEGALAEAEAAALEQAIQAGLIAPLFGVTRKQWLQPGAARPRAALGIAA